MTRYACEECGGPLERGRCADRECRELGGADLHGPPPTPGPRWVRDLLDANASTPTPRSDA